MVIPDRLDMYHVDEGTEFSGTNDLGKCSVVWRVPQNCREFNRETDSRGQAGLTVPHPEYDTSLFDSGLHLYAICETGRHRFLT